MTAWTIMLLMYLFGSYIAILTMGWWGVPPAALYYLVMARVAYSTLCLGYRSWLWPVTVPDELMYFNKPLPSEIHDALARLYLQYPELRTGIAQVLDSYVHRKGITSKLPITYPNGVYPHIVGYLCKHRLTDVTKRDALMRDVLCWEHRGGQHANS